MVKFLSIKFLLGFSKLPFFWVTLYKHITYVIKMNIDINNLLSSVADTMFYYYNT
jgi:hypothetical protein